MVKKNRSFEPFIKIAGILILGIVTPNIFGLITNSLYTPLELTACYFYFILVYFIIWQGNQFLMVYLPKKIYWHHFKFLKIPTIYFFANILYSGTISALLFFAWFKFSNEIHKGSQPIINTCLVIIIVSSFITNVYETMYLNNERRMSLSKAQQLNIAKVKAELEVLKNQTDPHFIFNSLNTLSYLISTNTVSARHFTNTLADVYRYILSNKEKDLVKLKDEIEFISNYFYLLKIRFGAAIDILIEINDVEAENYLIPPISLQILVENAIKHNKFNEEFPIEIHISIMSNEVVIKNVIRKNKIFSNLSETGLKNLNNRYQLITKRNIAVETVNNLFIVKLPILKF